MVLRAKLLALALIIIILQSCNNSTDPLGVSNEQLNDFEGQLMIEVVDIFEDDYITHGDYNVYISDESGQAHKLSVEQSDVEKYINLSNKDVKVKGYSNKVGIVPTSIKKSAKQNNKLVSAEKNGGGPGNGNGGGNGGGGNGGGGNDGGGGLNFLVVMVSDTVSIPPCTAEDIEYELIGADNPKSTAKMYEKISGGAVSIGSITTAAVTLSKRVSAYCSPAILRNNVPAFLLEQGISEDDYDYVMYVTDNLCGPSGILNGKHSLISYCSSSVIDVILAHEFGHNLGMNHSKGYSNGNLIEYGDKTCFMSNSSCELNALQRIRNGWIKKKDVGRASGGVYSISALESENPTEKQVYKVSTNINVDGVTQNYYLGFRTDLGDFAVASSYIDELTIHRWTGDEDDKTVYVEGISVGETFTDAENGVEITVLGIQGEVVEVQLN